MVPVPPQPVETPEGAYDLMQLRSGGRAPDTPLESELGVESTPTPARSPPAAVPVLRCGWCHGVIDEVGSSTSVRCRHCRHSVVVPSHIHITCDRCGHHTSIRPRTLAAPRLCSQCGAALLIGDVVLTPRRRQRVHHHRHRALSPAYADAAWAVLIIGLALVVALLAIS